MGEGFYTNKNQRSKIRRKLFLDAWNSLQVFLLMCFLAAASPTGVFYNEQDLVRSLAAVAESEQDAKI